MTDGVALPLMNASSLYPSVVGDAYNKPLYDPDPPATYMHHLKTLIPASQPAPRIIHILIFVSAVVEYVAEEREDYEVHC